MASYCKGAKCPRAKECLRVEAWENFPNKNTELGLSTGVWLVYEDTCMKNNYEDGVFRCKEE